MAIAKSALQYRRMKIARSAYDPTKQAGPHMPELRESAAPRYQMHATLSHRRGEKRQDKWVQNV